MSSTQYLTDAATRHAVFLQRYAGGQSKEALAELNRLSRNINARLAQEPTEFQRARLTAVLVDIEALSKEAFNTISRNTIHGAQNLAKVEAGFSVQLFNKATVGAEWTLPADATLIAGVMGSSMPVNQNSAISIEEALRQFSVKKTAQITQLISDGVTLGETTQTISKNVGTLINTLNRRQLDTLSRTITNHTASVTRGIVYEENADIIDGYQWISTLDGKTTFICGSRDKQVYQVGSGPLPPAHWGCRSTTIPKIKPEFDAGAKLKGRRPAKGATGAKTVSGRTTYGGWLKQQPKPFVDEALGVERSKMFRSGKLTIDKFVDSTGRVYTLGELERMNPFVFME
jgi:SPP1 gp7 family putative phage head morphogenesis protein